VLKLTDPVSALRYDSASRPRSIGTKQVRVPPGHEEIAMETYNNPRQPMGPFPNTDGYGGLASEKEVNKFEVAKDSAFREGEKDSRAASLANNGGDQNRGPIPGGAEPSGKGGPSNKATGVDRGAVICKGTFDVGPKGPKVTVQCGVAGHIDETPGKGVGGGVDVKDGKLKPGAVIGDAHGGDVYTLDDASKKAGASSSASPGKSAAPEGLDWTDDKHRIKDSVNAIKRDIPPPPPPQINDLGPSTNEPEQKAEDSVVARNDNARFGDDIAQRI
jgi:hypothetical protein